MDYQNYNSEEESIMMDDVGEWIYDEESGEVYEAIDPEIKKRGKSFAKLFMKDYIRFLKSTTSNHMHVEAVLLENIEFSRNDVTVTYEEICKETGISRPTVAKIMKEFQEAGFMVPKYGYYKVNPEIIAKGFEGFRLKLIREYYECKYEYAEKKKKKSVD